MKPYFNRSFFFITALLLVHLLFFLSSLIQSPAPFSDSEDYLNASQNLYGQGVLYCGDLSEPIVEEQFTRRPPLYPLFIGLIPLFGSNIPVFLLQILVSVLSILLVFRIFLSDFKGLLYPIIGVVLLMASPAQFIYSNRIMAEIPFQLLLGLMVWTVYKYYRQQQDQNQQQFSTNRYIWLFNLFLTLGMATKPVLFPFAVLTMLLSLLLFMKSRQWTFVLALILPVVWITFYSMWNFNRTGSTQYSSIQTANMVNYNMRYFIMGQRGSEAATMEVDRLYSTCESAASYKEKNKCLDQGVREVILDHPVKYGMFHLKGCVRYFLDPGRFDLVTFFNIREADSPGFLQAINKDGISGALKFLKSQGYGLVILLGLIALFKLVKISGFLIYLFRGKEELPLRIFLALLIGYLALVTGPLGASRFLLPVELLIIGGAVKGLTPLLLQLRPSTKRHP